MRRGVFTIALAAFACASTPGAPERVPQAPAQPVSQDGATSTSTATPIAQSQHALLAGEAVAVAYSGFPRSGQSPSGAAPSDAELLEDLRIISGTAGFSLIRLYDSRAVSARVLALIRTHQLDIKVMLGAWLDAEVSNHEGCPWLDAPIPAATLAKNTVENQAEIQRAIQLANQYPKIVVAVNVGNEALVSWNDHMVTLEALVAYAREVKAAVRVPVTTAENYVVWRDRGPELMAALDFAAVHTYPAWEEKTIDQAMQYTIENMQQVRDALPNARLAIGEAGWPSIASEFGPRASEANQKRYMDELTAWARAMNITTFVFEAFDEDWKGNPSDPLGAEKHWGLFNIDRTRKRVMRERE